MSERSFKTSGIRFGRIYGIELWIHWTLLLWFGYVFYLNWIGPAGPSRWEMVLHTGVWWLAVLGTIMVHELGHCFAAFRQGGGADAVVLWPLGGLAYCDAPHLPRNQFWVAAGGPLAQLVPMALAGAAILALGIDASAFPDPEEPYLSVVLGAVFWWNLVILAFNLIPLYPYDGGRMFQAILWGKLESFGRATLITIWTSRAAGIAGVLVCLIFLKQYFGMPAVLLLLWGLFETERLRARLLSGEDEGGNVFGYDFSRGYTSLERTATRAQAKSKTRASILERFKTRARESRGLREAEIRKRVDALLEKISREGLTSLTGGERKFLEQASRKFQRRDG